MPEVAIIMGSASDAPYMEEAERVLSDFGISYEVRVLSAHRNPEAVREYGMKAKERGIKVMIAGAGRAAHLPGVLASWTSIPVIGVAIPSGEFGALDALLSIVQMPAGVPVACAGVGRAGARNAGLLAASILGLANEEIFRRYEDFRRKLSEI